MSKIELASQESECSYTQLRFQIIITIRTRDEVPLWLYMTTPSGSFVLILNDILPDFELFHGGNTCYNGKNFSQINWKILGFLCIHIIYTKISWNKYILNNSVCENHILTRCESLVVKVIGSDFGSRQWNSSLPQTVTFGKPCLAASINSISMLSVLKNTCNADWQYFHWQFRAMIVFSLEIYLPKTSNKIRHSFNALNRMSIVTSTD